MKKKQKLFSKAKRNPGSISFKEIQDLAEFYGFTFDTQKGSHIQYKRRDDPYGFMNFQPRKNDTKMAKVFQVRQLIKFIEINTL